MKKCINKRWMLLGSLVVVLVLTTAGFAVSGIKGQFHRYHGDHGKDFVKERILSHMDYTMQELKLSAKQHVKYSAIRDKMSKAMDDFVVRHNTTKDALHSEMANPQPDIKTMAATLKKELSAMPESVNLQIDYMLEVYDILDKKQQDQLVKLFKEHMKDEDCS